MVMCRADLLLITALRQQSARMLFLKSSHFHPCPGKTAFFRASSRLAAWLPCGCIELLILLRLDRSTPMSLARWHERDWSTEIAQRVFLAVFDFYLQLVPACNGILDSDWLLLRRSGALCCTPTGDLFHCLSGANISSYGFPLSGFSPFLGAAAVFRRRFRRFWSGAPPIPRFLKSGRKPRWGRRENLAPCLVAASGRAFAEAPHYCKFLRSIPSPLNLPCP